MGGQRGCQAVRGQQCGGADRQGRVVAREGPAVGAAGHGGSREVESARAQRWMQPLGRSQMAPLFLSQAKGKPAPGRLLARADGTQHAAPATRDTVMRVLRQRERARERAGPAPAPTLQPPHPTPPPGRR